MSDLNLLRVILVERQLPKLFPYVLPAVTIRRLEPVQSPRTAVFTSPSAIDTAPVNVAISITVVAPSFLCIRDRVSKYQPSFRHQY